MSHVCGRLLVGLGGDTWDPECLREPGHRDECSPERFCANRECRKPLEASRVTKHGATTCDDKCRAAAWKAATNYGHRHSTLPVYGRGGVVTLTLVDAADYERLTEHRWHRNASGYVFRNLPRVGGKRPAPIFLHREVLGLVPGDGRIADHRNGDQLDNRSENLRAVTVSENSANRRGPTKRSTSGRRGVSYHKTSGLWRARAVIRGKTHSLGYYETAEAAAAVVSAFRRENMPTSEMDQPQGRANGRRRRSGIQVSYRKALCNIAETLAAAADHDGHRDPEAATATILGVVESALRESLSEKQRARLHELETNERTP